MQLLLNLLSLSYIAALGVAVSANSFTTNNPTTTPSMVQLSPDSDFHFELLRALNAAFYGGADIGEVLTAAAQLTPGSFESFYTAFYTLATRIDSTAQSLDASRFPISVRDALFRAATYFRSADFYLHGNGSDPRIDSLWVQQATAFNAALALLPAPARRVVVQAANFTVPCIYYPASTDTTHRRPTLLIGGGYDGGQEELYHQIVKGALQRGYNVMTYEGPGQATPRREQHLGFITAWETVVSPVVDYLLTLPEVDPSAVGLVGFSLGGFLAPRAAAFDHRFAALIALDGMYDFGLIFLQKLPAALIALFQAGDQPAFNAEVEAIRANATAPTELRWLFDQSLWSFDTQSGFDWLTRTQTYHLKGLVGRIPGPVFVGDGQDDMFYQGQAQQLAAELGDRATFHQFKTADGAGEHCAIGAQVLQNQVVLDWFQDVLDRRV